MTVEAIGKPGELRHLRDAWRVLEAASMPANPFLSWEWQWSWWEVFGVGYQPHHLLVRDGSEIIGLVPLCSTVAEPDRLLFSGGLNLSDRLGFLHTPGAEEAVARGLLSWARQGSGLALDLHFLPQASAPLVALRNQAANLGVAATEEAEEVCPGLDLPADFDTYLTTSLGKKDRHELRRKFRRLDQEREGWRMISPQELGLDEALEQFLRLLASSGAHKQAFLSAEVRAFFKLIATRLAERGWLRLRLLESRGELLAGIFGFTVADTWHLYNSGYDPNFAAFSPGLLCVAEGIRGAIAEGCTRADLLRGNEPYKYRLGARDEQLVRLQLEPGD